MTVGLLSMACSVFVGSEPALLYGVSLFAIGALVAWLPSRKE
jgi:hypothetical protein